MINEPTYATEHSLSLLDLVIMNNPFSILYSEVGPPLLDQTSYHLPIIGLLHHSSPHCVSFKRKVSLYDKGDYEAYRQRLSDIDWDNIFLNDDINIITSKITENLIEVAH